MENLCILSKTNLPSDCKHATIPQEAMILKELSNIVKNELYIQSILSIVQKQYIRDELTEITLTTRKEDLLICVLDGESLYRFADKERRLKTGDVIFLPSKCEYYRYILSPTYQAVLIYFRFEEKPGMTLSYSIFSSVQGIDLDFTKLLKKWNSRDLCTQSECICMLYGIYMRLIRSETSAYLPSSKRELFEAAVQKLATEYASEDFSISSLSAQAEMSEVHFRRCFKQIYHVSPQQYLLELRLGRAKELLLYDTTPVAEIARISGMPDPCYFSRLFKQKTGYAPSEYRAAFGTPHPD